MAQDTNSICRRHDLDQVWFGVSAVSCQILLVCLCLWNLCHISHRWCSVPYKVNKSPVKYVLSVWNFYNTRHVHIRIFACSKYRWSKVLHKSIPLWYQTFSFFLFFPVCDFKNMVKAEWQIKALAMKLGEAFTCQESSSWPDRQCRLRSSTLWSRLQKLLVYWIVRVCSVRSCVHRVLTIPAIICLRRHAKWCLCPPLHFCIKLIFFSDQHKQAWNLFCPPQRKKMGSIQVRQFSYAVEGRENLIFVSRPCFVSSGKRFYSHWGKDDIHP